MTSDAAGVKRQNHLLAISDCRPVGCWLAKRKSVRRESLNPPPPFRLALVNQAHEQLDVVSSAEFFYAGAAATTLQAR